MRLEGVTARLVVQARDLDRIDEGLDGGFSSGADIFWEGVCNGVYEGEYIISLPHSVNHVEDILSD